MRATALALPMLLLAACHGGADQADGGGSDGGTAATPVRLATVTRTTLLVIVRAPGRTASTELQQVRAPFTGELLDLVVADGDRVRGGQMLGTMVSQNSMAALQGARSMVSTARTARQRRDARRALALARRGLVEHKLRAPEAGVVVSHSADEGALVSAEQVIVTLAALDSIVFVAEVVQNDLPRVRPGQRATIELAARRQPSAAVVHALLPSASAQTLTAPVRLDFVEEAAVPTAVNLFGTAHIVVDERRDVLAVPDAAVLRDDVTGVKRIATVTRDERLRWVRVTTGVRQRGLVEILTPPLAVGASVIVAGQVGLTDGTRVRPGAP